jgi:hypothetical protein
VAAVGFTRLTSSADVPPPLEPTCYPGFGVSEVLGRLESVFYRKPNDEAFEIIQNILNLAARKVGPDKVLYLEVSEKGNSRSSFDINLYGANFRLQELHSNILAMGRHYLIPDDEFSRFFDSIKRCTLGHIAGGVDRKGRDFLTVYFGE